MLKASRLITFALCAQSFAQKVDLTTISPMTALQGLRGKTQAEARPRGNKITWWSRFLQRSPMVITYNGKSTDRRWKARRITAGWRRRGPHCHKANESKAVAPIFWAMTGPLASLGIWQDGS